MKLLFYFFAFFCSISIAQARTIDRFVSRGYVDGFLDQNWKGNPKMVEIINFTLDENHQLTDDKIRIKNKYDEKGRHVQSTLIYGSISEIKFEYDEKDRISEFGMSNSEELFSYNEKGQIIKSIINFKSDKSPEIKTYTYNNDELIISKVKDDSIIQEILYKMKKKDSLNEITTFDLKTGRLKFISKVRFDQNLKRISSNFLDENSNPITTQFYYYNKNKDVVKTKTLQFKEDEESITECVKIRYEYDIHGNKIKEETMKNGELIDYTEYKIEYY